MSEQHLILRAQRGDREAADALLSAHWRDVYRLLYSRLGNRSEAEDLTQETFTRMWRALPTFRGDDIGPFTRTIALNLMRNFLRDNARHPHLELGEADAEVPSAESDALNQYGQSEIQALMMSLRDDHRQVLELRLIEALSVGEVAERMSRSPEAVRSLQYRALHELRGLLQAAQDSRKEVR